MRSLRKSRLLALLQGNARKRSADGDQRKGLEHSVNPKTKQAFAEHLLNHQTWPERLLWSRLRYKGIGYSFQRQAIVWGFIVDFWCPTAKVAVELDGPIHEKQKQADADRDDILARAGIEVLRFQNSDVRKGMTAVLIRIWEHCYGRAPEDFRPTYGATKSRRYCGNEDLQALTDYQTAKLGDHRAFNFSRRYWKSKPYSVHNQ